MKDERKAEIGQEIAEIFMLKKQKRTGWYITAWGHKSDIGLTNTFLEISRKLQAEIQDGIRRKYME